MAFATCCQQCSRCPLFSARRDCIVATVRNIWATWFALGTTTVFQTSWLPAVGTGTHLAAHEVAATVARVTNEPCLAPFLATGRREHGQSAHGRQSAVQVVSTTSPTRGHRVSSADAGALQLFGIALVGTRFESLGLDGKSSRIEGFLASIPSESGPALMLLSSLRGRDACLYTSVTTDHPERTLTAWVVLSDDLGGGGDAAASSVDGRDAEHGRGGFSVCVVLRPWAVP